jgi:hypothetical protein
MGQLAMVRKNLRGIGGNFMKKSTKIGIGVVALVAIIAILLGVYKATRPETTEGAKTVTVAVIHGDGSENDFELHTDAEYLADALIDNGVVEDNQTEWGLYILTADGETADESQQQWWCLTQDGEMTSVGASEQPINDGEHYELTFTEGYDY